MVKYRVMYFFAWLVNDGRMNEERGGQRDSGVLKVGSAFLCGCDARALNRYWQREVRYELQNGTIRML